MATDLGTRIKRARERKRWTQRQLADALGVNVKTVDNWENGRTSPKSSTGALEEVLGVRFDEPEPALDPERIRNAFLNAGYPPERADYFMSVVLGVANGTLTVTRNVPEPGEDPQARQAAG